MPRYKASNQQPDNSINILEAIKMVKFSKCSVKSAAAATGIPQASLFRYISKLDTANVDVTNTSDNELIDFIKNFTKFGAKSIMNLAQEKTLIEHLLKAKNLYCGLSISEIRTLAYHYAQAINITYPSSWDKNLEASNDWYYAFMNRHPNLSLRSPEQSSQHRVRSFNKESMESFFNNLSTIVGETTRETHDENAETHAIDDCKKYETQFSNRIRTREDSNIYGDYIASKHRKYSDYTQSVVEHLIADILYKADMGCYEPGETTDAAMKSSSNAAVNAINTTAPQSKGLSKNATTSISAALLKEEYTDLLIIN